MRHWAHAPLLILSHVTYTTFSELFLVYFFWFLTNNNKSFFKNTFLTILKIPLWREDHQGHNELIFIPIAPKDPPGGILQDFSLHQIYLLTFQFRALSQFNFVLNEFVCRTNKSGQSLSKCFPRNKGNNKINCLTHAINFYLGNLWSGKDLLVGWREIKLIFLGGGVRRLRAACEKIICHRISKTPFIYLYFGCNFLLLSSLCSLHKEVFCKFSASLSNQAL